MCDDPFIQKYNEIKSYTDNFENYIPSEFGYDKIEQINKNSENYQNHKKNTKEIIEKNQEDQQAIMEELKNGHENFMKETFGKNYVLFNFVNICNEEENKKKRKQEIKELITKKKLNEKEETVELEYSDDEIDYIEEEEEIFDKKEEIPENYSIIDKIMDDYYDRQSQNDVEIDELMTNLENMRLEPKKENIYDKEGKLTEKFENWLIEQKEYVRHNNHELELKEGVDIHSFCRMSPYHIDINIIN